MYTVCNNIDLPKPVINSLTKYSNVFWCLKEEESQENEQKIELERKNVKEARSELEKHNKAITDLDRKYKDVKNKREQLSDEAEQLKVGVNKLWQNFQVSSWQSTISFLCLCDQEEQVKAEAERNKLEHALKTLEGKLKAHQDSIKTKRENLTCKENEKQVLTSNHILYLFI